MSEPTRYPLAWPAHRPRKAGYLRRDGVFKSQGRSITIAAALQRVEDELERLGGKYPLLSTNLELRVDGVPRADRAPPSDPGVCLYFSLKGQPFALACDTYSSVAQNVAALAAHIDATRAITRHGVASAEETLQAFSALPPPSGASAPIERPWRVVLGLSAHFPDGLNTDEARGVVTGRFRDRAKLAHADAGGSDDAMRELNGARDAAFKEIAQ